VQPTPGPVRPMRPVSGVLVEPEEDPPTPAGFFAGYAAWTVRRRWPIIAAWLLALAGLVALPPVGTGGNELASIIPLDSPAISSELRALEEFGFPLSSRVAVVQRNPDGLSLFVQAESVLDALAVDQGPKPQWPLLGALPITNSLRLFGSGGETNTSVLTYLFMDPTSSFASQQEAADRYIADHLERSADHVVGVAGSVPARAEQAMLVSDNVHRLELLTVLAIVVLVGLTFRSLMAPAIALIASAIAFIATINLSEVLSGLAGISTPAELEPLLVALLLGVVTDYTIFYVTALQGRLGDTAQWRHAVRDAVRTDTPIVLAAGITVAAGTAALLAAESEFFRAFGPAMALAVLVGLVVSVTFVPAAIAVLGPLVFWPSDPRRRRTQATTQTPTPTPTQPTASLPAEPPRSRPGHAPGPRGRLVHLLASRRAAAAVVVGCVGMLLIASVSLRDLDLGVGFTSSLPPDNPVAVASTAASTAFAPGITSPTTMLVEKPGVVDDLPSLVALQHLIEGEDGVAGVVGPAQNVTERAFNVVLSTGGDAARMLVVFDHDPLDATAIDNLRALRDRLPQLVQQAGLGGAVISLGGDTALAEGLVSSTEADLYRIAIAGVVVNLLLLVLFLRALVAPLFLLASSVLALSASLGLTVWLFGDVGGVDGLTFYVPFAAAVLLVSLGSDYNIFGVGRVWEEARHLPLRDAVLKAVPESSRAITSAGVTLALSFGMLALIPLTPFRELAFAMAVGILIDAFVVRSLLVPAMLVLVGPASGWPGPHLRADRHTKR
jgi:putative drug exporter of the RND superfamily